MAAEQSAFHNAQVNRLARIFLPFAVGHFLSYIFRTINAIIAGDLEADVGVSASELGLLTSTYLLAFACFQLPLGVLLDRIGPRRVESVLLAIAGIGALVFALGQNLLTLTAGRALIGLGVSACLMASFKMFALWYAQDRLPAMNGYLLAFGGLGAITATVPAEASLGIIGWRGLFIGLAIACVGLALVLWWVVPEKPTQGRVQPLGRQVAELGGILRSREFWHFAPAGMLFPGGLMAIQGLWAGPWLRDVAGYERDVVAQSLLWLAVATTVGFALWGTLTARLSRMGLDSMQVVGGGMALCCLCTAILALQPGSFVLATWLLLGLSGASGTLLYALLSRSYDPALMGRVVTALNLMIFLGAFALQWGLGFLIELPAPEPGQRYAPLGYQLAFGVTAILQLLTLAWILWPRVRATPSAPPPAD